MRKSHWTPSIIPTDNNQKKRETTAVQDLLSGQYNNPIRVVAFNTEERCTEDVSEDVVHELRRRCDRKVSDLPSSFKISSSGTKITTVDSSPYGLSRILFFIRCTISEIACSRGQF